MKLPVLKNRRITNHEVDNSQKTEELLPMKLLILKNRRITTHEVGDIFLLTQSSLKDNLNLMPNLFPTCFVCV
jgi:hypothetical protein